MKTVSRKNGKFMSSIGKVLLPVLLSLFVSGGILAKYLNEINLNKSSLESAYQSMKKQHLECIGAQNRLRGKLTVIRASVHGLQESIQLGVAPPEPFWKNVTSVVELEATWENVMVCYGVFTNLLIDMHVMLGEDGLDLTKIIERRYVRLDSLIGGKNEVSEKLCPLELDGLFIEVRESSVDEFKRRSQEWGGKLKIALSALKELNQILTEAFRGQDDDFDESNGIAIKALKREFETGPFGFFVRMAR